MRSTIVVLGVAALLVGLPGCGDDDDDDDGGSQQGATPVASSEPILIKARVDIPTGEVLGGSSIGDSPFCPGGTCRDRHGSADPSVPPYGLVDRTFRCPDGSLRIGFTPGEPLGRTQAGPWKVVSGTGAFKGLQGGRSDGDQVQARQRHERSRDAHRDGYAIATRSMVIAPWRYEGACLTNLGSRPRLPGRLLAVALVNGSGADVERECPCTRSRASCI